MNTKSTESWVVYASKEGKVQISRLVAEAPGELVIQSRMLSKETDSIRKISPKPSVYRVEASERDAWAVQDDLMKRVAFLELDIVATEIALRELYNKRKSVIETALREAVGKSI